METPRSVRNVFCTKQPKVSYTVSVNAMLPLFRRFWIRVLKLRRGPNENL